MAFFNVHGSASRGAHSDAHVHVEGLRRQIRLQTYEKMPHGPVKVLMENGKRLEPPKVIPVSTEYVSNG